MIVEEILDERVAWADEYATENGDYTSGYDHIVSEVSHDWPGPVEEWIRDNCHDRMGYGPFDNCMSVLVGVICDDIDGRCIDAEWEFNHSEYAAYSGSGCCLWGFDIGECEEQIDIDGVPEFKELHSQGRLHDILESVNCNAYIGSLQYPLRGDYPCFEFYHNPGGRWDCIISEERMKEHLTAAIIGICRRAEQSSR